MAVTGQSTGSEGDLDYYTAKYAGTSGMLLWEIRYNGPGDRQDRVAGLAVDRSGNVIVTGDEPYTAKYAALDGALLWERRDGGGSAPALDSSGNVVVTGSSSSSYGYYTAKYAAATGALLWERPNGGGSTVAVDGSGNVVVATPSSDAYYAAKYAGSDGAVLWEKFVSVNHHNRGVALAVDRSGNVLLAGSSDLQFYTAKLAGDNGRLLWEKRHDEGGAWARAVAVDRNDNVVITGGSYIAKYAAADGTMVWETRASGGNSAIALDANDNVVVTGGIQGGPGFYSRDFYMAKYAAADGAFLWEKRYNGPANRSDSAVSLAIARNGMIVVTGSGDYYHSFQLRSVPQAVTKSDYVTIAYWEDMSPLSIERVSSGLRIRLNGIPDGRYEIERANSVAGPWSTVATVTAPSQGVIEYIDSNQPTTSVFYRARTQ